MKNIVVIISFIALFSSCLNQPKCNSDDAKELVLEILYDNINDNFNIFRYNLIIDQYTNYNSYTNKDGELYNETRVLAYRFLFFKGGVGELKTVRTLNKNENIKSCECEAGLKISEEDIKKIDNDILELDSKINITQLYGVLNYEDLNNIPISYNLQITDEGELYAEVDITQDIIDYFMVYSIIKEIIVESKNKK